MRYLNVLIIITAVLFVSAPDAFAQHHRRPVTPYGDFCPRCTKYGICRTPMSDNDAGKALVEYYHEKGLAVEVGDWSGRFIRAKIKDNGRVVDEIIFDRRTGRIRSIY